MHAMLKQLGELLLGSVPTVIMLLFLWTMYSILVHRPLMKVLGERRAKTQGAIEKSRADVAAAEARTAEYGDRIREARASVFQSQEARRKAALDARAAALTSARAKAQQQVEDAKAAMEKDKAEAQANLQAESGRMAAEIVTRVLRPVDAQSPMGGGQ
jgi:F-type H+-transporting ATPase subunit b